MHKLILTYRKSHNIEVRMSREGRSLIAESSSSDQISKRSRMVELLESGRPVERFAFTSTILQESNIPAMVGTLMHSESGTSLTTLTARGDSSSSSDDDDDELYFRSASIDPYSVSQVLHYVSVILQKWNGMTAIPPDEFLKRILSLRGYSSEMIAALSSQLRVQPTLEQINDYDSELVTAVRQSDLAKVKTLNEQYGRNLRACNRFGESIVHMACRRSEIDVVKYIMDNTEDPWVIDDFGRTPLHDACWRPEPRFDIVTLILDKNLDLLRFVDIRGSNPLNYVRKEHWLEWCAYLFHMKDKYWK